MSQVNTNRSVEARRLKREADLSAARRSGNGTVADVAAFCRVSERTVLNWKEEDIIGRTQIGANIWFSADDVAELPAQYHHSGKYSKVPPGEVKERVRMDWREFLGAADADAMDRRRLDCMEKLLESFYPGALEMVARGQLAASPIVDSRLARAHSADHHEEAA